MTNQRDKPAECDFHKIIARKVENWRELQENNPLCRTCDGYNTSCQLHQQYKLRGN